MHRTLGAVMPKFLTQTRIALLTIELNPAPERNTTHSELGCETLVT